MEEIITLDGKQFKLTTDRPLTAEQKEQVIAEIRKQTGCGTCGPKVSKMGNDWQYGGHNESEESPGMLHKELRVSGTAMQSSLTPTVGKKIRVYAAHVSITVTSNLTAALRASLSFGTGGTTDVTKILWSHRVDNTGESQIFISGINTIGAVDETVTLSNMTYSAGAALTRAIVYYKEE